LADWSLADWSLADWSLADWSLADWSLADWSLAVANFAEATEAEMLLLNEAGFDACPVLIRDFLITAMVDPPGSFRISFRPTCSILRAKLQAAILD